MSESSVTKNMHVRNSVQLGIGNSCLMRLMESGNSPVSPVSHTFTKKSPVSMEDPDSLEKQSLQLTYSPVDLRMSDFSRI